MRALPHSHDFVSTRILAEKRHWRCIMDTPLDVVYRHPPQPAIYKEFDQERLPAKDEVKDKLPPSCRGLFYHTDLIQGSEEWLQARCGLLTASDMNLIVTPTLKAANNDKTRTHLYELLAQRVTGYVEPHYISDDMLRGMDDEIIARDEYTKHHAPVEQTGFITNDKWGFTIGYSPDGLVGDDGLIECKSRRQKYQVQTIIEKVATDTAVPDYLIQVQTGMLVAERNWCDLDRKSDV